MPSWLGRHGQRPGSEQRVIETDHRPARAKVSAWFSVVTPATLKMQRAAAGDPAGFRPRGPVKQPRDAVLAPDPRQADAGQLRICRRPIDPAASMVSRLARATNSRFVLAPAHANGAAACSNTTRSTSRPGHHLGDWRGCGPGSRKASAALPAPSPCRWVTSNSDEPKLSPVLKSSTGGTPGYCSAAALKGRRECAQRNRWALDPGISPPAPPGMGPGPGVVVLRPLEEGQHLVPGPAAIAAWRQWS